MRIAQVAPLFESVPPKLYGGTERIVHALTEALISAGHELTLFASGDSETSATLVGTGLQGLRLAGCRDTLTPHILMFEKVRRRASEFDIVHFHNETWHFAVARALGTPTLTTLHGRLDLQGYSDLFSEFQELPLVSLSALQQEAQGQANWLSTIHHGLDPRSLIYSPRSSSYLAFLGRISPEKGLEHAVEIAIRTGRKLKIAAKIEPLDESYFKSVRPLFKHPLIEYVGEINDLEKSKFLGGAEALLFPISWPEPFGLVMIESLATGTPVIAFRNGSVPEVITHGKTGFVVDSVDEAVAAVGHIETISRSACRFEFLNRFTAKRMANDYLSVYERVIANSPSGPRSTVRLRRTIANRSWEMNRGEALKGEHCHGGLA